MNTRVCAVSFHHTETPWAQSNNRKTTITHNNCWHCRVPKRFPDCNYSCFEKSCLYKHREKLTRQCRKFLWIIVVFTVALFLIPIGIVAYSFTLLWDNLSRNSCSLADHATPARVGIGSVAWHSVTGISGKSPHTKSSRAKMAEGGRNTRLPSGYAENFVNAVEEDLQCSACHLPLKEPVLTRCGHRFCKECLEEHFKRSVLTWEIFTPVEDIRLNCNFSLRAGLCSWLMGTFSKAT